MQVHNLMEDLVFRLLDQTLDKIPGVCRCQECRNDIAALVLNNLSPKYVATDKGYVYGKVSSLMYQVQTDIIRQITIATGIVMANPRHENRSL